MCVLRYKIIIYYIIERREVILLPSTVALLFIFSKNMENVVTIQLVLAVNVLITCLKNDIVTKLCDTKEKVSHCKMMKNYVFSNRSITVENVTTFNMLCLDVFLIIVLMYLYCKTWNYYCC